MDDVINKRYNENNISFHFEGEPPFFNLGRQYVLETWYILRHTTDFSMFYILSVIWVIDYRI